MKRMIATLGLTILLLVGVISTASASHDQALPDPGLTPDSPLYVFKDFFEGLRVFFTFDPADRAEVAADLATLKVAELQKMVEAKKPKAAGVALENYETYVDLAEESLDQADPGVSGDVQSDASGDADTSVSGDVDTDVSGDAVVDRIAAIRSHVSAMTAKHLVVLTALLNKVPESARPAIQHAIEASSHGHEVAGARAGGWWKGATEDAVGEGATDDVLEDGSSDDAGVVAKMRHARAKGHGLGLDPSAQKAALKAQHKLDRAEQKQLRADQKADRVRGGGQGKGTSANKSKGGGRSK